MTAKNCKLELKKVNNDRMLEKRATYGFLVSFGSRLDFFGFRLSTGKELRKMSITQRI